MPPVRKLPFAQSQWDFIQTTRDQVDTQESFFDSHDWQNIAPKGGRHSSLRKPVCVDSFYVKPVASWIPHRLIPNHIPKCPHCESAEHVDIGKARWINSPKILCGMSQHKYLDTKLYPCSHCNKRFAGYDRRSIGLDGEKVMGFFNIHLAQRFTVDEQLYSFVTSCHDVGTPTIHRIST